MADGINTNKMNAVHGSILENLRKIVIVNQETVEAFKRDKNNTSDSRELTVTEFIGSYLPSDFVIKERGKIYSKTQESNNIDCIVLAPNHPKLITPIREVILAEGVFAAIEVKPNISTLTDKSEFMRGLKQIKSVKNIYRKTETIDISRLTGQPKRPAYFERIPSVIFSSTCSSLEKTVKFISKKVEIGELGYEELPDIIISLDKGLIMYSPHFDYYKGIIKNFKAMGINNVKRGFLTFETNDKAHILARFLTTFLGFPMPTLQLSDFIVQPYLKQIRVDEKVKYYPLN